MNMNFASDKIEENWIWNKHNISWSLCKSNNKSEFAVLLVHGFGACKEHWRSNQKVIGETLDCYAIDLIGFGNTSQPVSRLKDEEKTSSNFFYCFDNWSRQISDFSREIIQKPVILIGNSIGGVISLKTAQIMQADCKGVIVIDCAQRTMDDKRLDEQSLFMKFLRPTLKNLVKQRVLSKTIFNLAANRSFIRSILNVAYPTKENINEELINILYEPTQRINAAEAFRGFINLFDDYLAPELIKTLKIPVFMIWGEKDPWENIEEAKKWLKELPQIQSLDIIPNAGHCPHDEKPVEVNLKIMNILNKLHKLQ